MNVKQHSHDKLVALRPNMVEADIEETELIGVFADILRKVLPQSRPQNTPQHHPKIEHIPKIEMLAIEGC